MPNLFLALYFLALLSTQSSPVYPVSFHRILCVFWMVLWVELLRSRSTFSCPFLHNICLTSGFAGILQVHRQSLCSPLARASTARARDLPGACGPRLLQSPLPTTACGVVWRLQRLPLARGLPLASYGSHAPPEAVPTPLPSPPLIRASIVGYFPVFMLLCFVLGFSSCAIVLLRFIAVLVLWLGLFEPFCHLKLLRAALGKAWLVCDSFGVMGDHHCLLLLVCFCVWLPFLLEIN